MVVIARTVTLHAMRVPRIERSGVLRHAVVVGVRTDTLQVLDLMRGLRGCAAADDSVAYSMWILVFPIMWAALGNMDEANIQAQVPALECCPPWSGYRVQHMDSGVPHHVGHPWQHRRG